MSKTVILPIDVSQTDAAVAALDFARDTMNLADAKVVVLSVMPHIPAYVSSELPEEVFANARTEMETELGKFAAENGLEGRSEIAIRRGAAGREIVECANETGADMILISSHDPEFSDIIFGSVAAFVVRHAHCSVVVVRKPKG